MAFASGGGLGTANSKTASQTIAVTLTGGASVGDLVVVFSAWDNDTGTASETGPARSQVACTDSVGNIYWTLHGVQAGGTAVHASSELFLTRVRTALNTNDVITLTNLSTALVAKAMSVHKFTMDTAKRWAMSTRGPISAVTNAADPAALSLSSLTSKPYLLLHVLGAEGPDSDAYTWDSDYTQVTGDGTTGGSDDTNIHVRGGYRIATLTSDTVDVTSDTADRDYVQGLIAISEEEYDGSFPNNPILDDFTRANESPLGSGLWSTTCSSDPDDPGVGGPGGYCKLVSNQAATVATGLNGHGGSWWNQFFLDTADAEVFATFATLPSATSPPTNHGSRGVGVQLHGLNCGSSDGSTTSRTAQELKWERKGTLTAPVDCMRLGTATSFTVGAPLLRGWRDVVADNKIGLQRLGNILNAWVDVGGGWEWVAGLDYLANIVPSAGNYKLGIDLTGSETRVDDFGGGPLSAFIPQIYRRVYG